MSLSNSIQNAILIATKPHTTQPLYEILYGGETLLNRSLIAMSKSGILNVTIIAPPGFKDKFEKMIQKVKHRLVLEYSITELEHDQILSNKVKEAVSSWKNHFLFYEIDKIMHPTFLKQAVEAADSGKAVIFSYKDVFIKEGYLHFEPSFKQKFKIIFANPAGFNKITIDNIQPSIFNSGSVDLSAQNKYVAYTENGNGVVSTDVIACSVQSLENIPDYRSLEEAVKHLLNKNQLVIEFVKEAWWIRVTPAISKSHIKEFFWKIAFKEISGEFSKAVNSKFSKPLSFYFARKGVTPNTLSNAQLFLFIFASCFLLIDSHWAMIIFAVLWQFSAGILDRCDGEVARIRNHESEAGGRFDMIIDDMRFGLPFLFLGGVLYHQTQNSLYLIACSIAFAWFIVLILYEQHFMRKAGYTSRQVMYVDYLKLSGEQSRKTTFLKKYTPIVKGDIRTFYVFLLALFGLKEFVFWVLLTYLSLIPISSFIGILKFKKEFSKK